MVRESFDERGQLIHMLRQLHEQSAPKVRVNVLVYVQQLLRMMDTLYVDDNSRQSMRTGIAELVRCLSDKNPDVKRV